MDHTVTFWIESLKRGEAGGAEQIWQRYFSQLCSYARNRLPNNVRREFDEEDVALSAIDTLYRGVEKGKYPRLNDRNNLWSLLLVITSRKVSHRLRDRNAQKRGGDFVRVENRDETGLDVVKLIAGNEPTPEFAAETTEQLERLMQLIPEGTTRRVAELKMAGFANEEIAQRLECGKRTVERKLMLIRRTWTEHES